MGILNKLFGNSDTITLSKTDCSKLLPLGTVVRLKNGEKKLMIHGVKQSDASKLREYDYIAVLYPEGYIGDLYQYLFNHDDIDEIVFRGFEDAEREDFIKKLSEAYKGK